MDYVLVDQENWGKVSGPKQKSSWYLLCCNGCRLETLL